ncbi:phenazine biosynthesis protein phzE [Saccharothrix ecbatanensis]|uniref:anthranilate synthase n=1 Tax=Saccharothrix ecbatanensis TaxID=1105145 RepID=A0A7W9HL78_9PSEU|nr:chorismate-binding protein [Saccharothrix ecbatanensis]MBB5803784.1 phenazine biosynthesis protein phzE [Saccharothrix ecbatanensis]
MNPLLARVLGDQPPPFALIHRPATAGPDTVDLIIGEVTTPDTLAAVPMPAVPMARPTPVVSMPAWPTPAWPAEVAPTVPMSAWPTQSWPTQAVPMAGPIPAVPTPAGARRAGHSVLVLVPYKQITERGYVCVDDGTPLVAMTVTDQTTLSLAEVAAALPDVPIHLENGRYEPDDDGYAEIVRRVVAEEIGTGEGANFVVKRSYTADIADYGPHRALSFFRRLLSREQSAYWTFVVHTGDRTLVGATPERHVSLRDGVAVMNPISGTYRYPPGGPTSDELLAFLADRKETDELYMVVDEELKMMARLCERGGRVVGPFLKEMAHLAHTEYLIEGRTARGPLDILRETMFAPTVTGSPLENACRVIARHEPAGRGYYSGVVALIGADESGDDVMDSAILIRTADIDPTGHLGIAVGATLVRHSDPASETAETKAKAASLLTPLQADGRVTPAAPARPKSPSGGSSFRNDPEIRAALARRNLTLADFWLTDADHRAAPVPVAAGRRALVVDMEDTFTAMIDHLLRSAGLDVTVRRYDEPHDPDEYELVVLGPGPGNPQADDERRTAHLRAAVDRLLAHRRPFLAVCLSHQVLSSRLGLDVVRRDVPNQGVQREIDLFGDIERVGFYNTYAARSDTDVLLCEGFTVQMARDARTGEVDALRGPFFASTQFHPESILTTNGADILARLFTAVLTSADAVTPG